MMDWVDLRQLTETICIPFAQPKGFFFAIFFLKNKHDVADAIWLVHVGDWDKSYKQICDVNDEMANFSKR